jgi:hypothetical protein
MAVSNRGSLRGESVSFVLLCILIAGSAMAEVPCQRSAENVGLDQGYPVRAELATVPHGRVTGREVVRYFVRFDAGCLLSQEVQRVDAMAVRLYNELMAGSGGCRPPEIGRPARILFGTVPAAADLDTRTLEIRTLRLPKPALWTLPIPLSRREITSRWSRLGNLYCDVDNPRHVRDCDPFDDRTTKLRGGWATLPLGETVAVVEGRDVVLGLEIVQEPWECPLLVSGPFEAPGPQRGSYLQLAQYEIENADGSTTWRHLDCNANGTPDANEGFAFAVDDAGARSVCGLSFRHAAFQWNLRAVAQLSQPLTPPE